MTTGSRVPVLPPEITAKLAASRKTPEELYPLLLALNEAGWSLASLAAPFGVTREAIRIWLNTGRAVTTERAIVDGPPLTPTQVEDRARRADAKNRREDRKMREEAALFELLPQLKALQSDARALRGPSDSSPTFAAASAEYTRLLNEAINRGVTATRLAKELEIQPVTIYARLRRGGYRHTAPSERQPNWATGNTHALKRTPVLEAV